MEAQMTKKALAELVGTFWLVFGGVGSAVLALGAPGINIGLTGVSLAFGLSVVTMAYAIGHISGCHLNPAVTLGLVAGGRFKAADAPLYIAAQIVGACVAALVLSTIAGGKEGFDLVGSNFGANGFGAHSPEGYPMGAAFLCEVVMTFIFLFVILGATDTRAPQGFAPLAIGLALTLIHLVSIPVTRTSVNPARSISQALFVGGWALEQLWLFIVAPILGGVLGALAYRAIASESPRAASKNPEPSPLPAPAE
jgi:aquaporin Z